jgi:hypothetical protein
VVTTPMAALLVLVATLAAARGARRWRHRRAGVPGAWSEVLDLLVLMGRPAPPARPATEVAADLARAAPVRPPGPHPAILIARAADRARFSPSAPPSRTGPEARAAWSAVRALRRAVRAAVPALSRLLWMIDPRPLRRRRPPRARR